MSEPRAAIDATAASQRIPFFARTLEPRGRPALERLQWDRPRAMLDEVAGHNTFYRQKWAAVGADAARVHTLDDLRRLPFTTKSALLQDQLHHPPFGAT